MAPSRGPQEPRAPLALAELRLRRQRAARGVGDRPRWNPRPLGRWPPCRNFWIAVSAPVTAWSLDSCLPEGVEVTEGNGSTSKTQLLVAFIGGSAMVVAALIGASESGQINVTVSPEPTPTAVANPTATVTVTMTAEPDDGGSTDTSVFYLEDLEPVEDMLDVESFALGATTYPHSLINPLSSCSQTGPVGWVLPAGASRVLAEVGVDPASVEPDSQVTFWSTSMASSFVPSRWELGSTSP